VNRPAAEIPSADSARPRRDFLRTAALGTTALGLWPALARGATAATPPATGKSGTSTATGKVSNRHRNLFNGDSCVFFYNPEIYQPEDFSAVPDPTNPKAKIVERRGPFKPIAIDRYVQQLAASGIDTFLVNPNASRAWYPSKVIPGILDGYQRGDREYFRGHAVCQGITPGDKPAEEKFIDRMMAFMDLYQDLLDQKVDWFAEAAKACRKYGVAPWASIRMNDFHGAKNIDGSFMNVPLLKNPAMRLKNSAHSPTLPDPGYRTALNYEKQEVRDPMAAQIKEAVEDYDYEGLELDWWRQPLCCEPNASAATIAMMTDWIRAVRALTQKRAAALGRPYPLGLRIPGKLATMKSIGLDVVTLCREGTIDFICPSNFWCSAWEMPHDELRRQLGDRVAIYGVIEDGPNTLPTRSLEHDLIQRHRFSSASHELLAANAAGKLVLGADGVEWFNFFCTDQVRLPGITSRYDFLRDLDRLEPLRGQSKHYCFSLTNQIIVQPPFEITPQLPVTLGSQHSHLLRLPMCAEPVDRNLELVVQVVIKADQNPAVIPVAFNDCWPNVTGTPTTQLLFPCGSLDHHVVENKAYNFSFPISLVRDGWNELSVENGGKDPLTIVCVELAVRPIASV
jgi:hypothetical protein